MASLEGYGSKIAFGDPPVTIPVSSPPVPTHDFERLLDKTPGDWGLRLIYADWLEDQNKIGEARVQRWMVENQKHPFNTKNNFWWWFSENRVWTTDPCPESNINHELFARIHDTKFPRQYLNWTVDFTSRAEAEEALGIVLGYLEGKS